MTCTSNRGEKKKLICLVRDDLFIDYECMCVLPKGRLIETNIIMNDFKLQHCSIWSAHMQSKPSAARRFLNVQRCFKNV